ncbi:MAG: lipopolysaccharide biosynthesis protein [ANME-2 cluster archaeon]|nr:lipopolysaccharide biosynthesis protein [ANME-2 cluster archaeon]
MSLTKKTIINLSAVGLLQILAKILNSVTLIILARLLLPSDFGIVAMAGILITIVDRFKDFGISNAIIQKQDKFEESLQTGFIMRSATGIFLFFIIFIIAPYWAIFFNDQAITSVLRILAIILILENFRFLPEIKLTKTLRFKTIVESNLLGYISYSAVAIALAYSGYSFWSIIYGRIAQSLISTIYYWIKSPVKLQLYFDKKIAKELYGYGKYVFATGLMVLLIDNVNYIVLGKILGPTVLGYYFIAYSWATFSSREVMAIVDRVLFPTYSTIKSDIGRVGNAYLKTLKYTSIISIPMNFGIFALAPEFVNIVLGEKWGPSILPLQILCILGLLLSLNSTTSGIYYSIGVPKIATILTGVQLFLMIILVLPAAKLFGINGAAALVSLLMIIITPINFVFVGRFLKIKTSRFIKILIPPTFSACVMTIIIFMIKQYTHMVNIFLYHPLIYLLFLLFSGIIIYSLILIVLTKGRIIEDIRILCSNLKS